MIKNLACLLVAVVVSLVCPASAAAVDTSGEKTSSTSSPEVVKIEFMTWLNLSYKDLISTVPLKPRSTFSQEALRQSVAALYQREIFLHVEPLVYRHPKGVVVRFVLTSKLAISSIVFRDSSSLERKQLQRVAGIRPGDAFDLDSLRQAQARVVNFYKDNAYRDVVAKLRFIDMRVEPRVALEFIVDEGYRSKIGSISIVGESSEQIKALEKSIRASAVTLPATSENIKRIERDILAKVRELGYLKASVEKISEKYDPLSQDVGVAFRVNLQAPISIQFAGNKVFSSAELLAPLKLQTRSVPVTASAIITLQKRIRDLYEAKGYFFANINLLEKKSENNALIYLIEIDEGIAYSISRIAFSGNDGVATDQLLRAIKTRIAAPWPFTRWRPGFAVTAQLRSDTDALADLYKGKGIDKTKVTYTVSKLENSDDELIVEFFIEQGVQRVAKKVDLNWVDILVNAEEESPHLLEQLLSIRSEIKANTPIVGAAISKERERILRLLRKQGFANARVTAQYDARMELLRFDIQLGLQVRVGKVSVVGNTFTHDRVIRQELLLSEGDLWDSEKINGSVRGLYGLGFFDTVSIQAADGNLDQVVEDLIVKVHDRDTGSFETGGSFTSEDGLHLTTELAQRNLQGDGGAIILGVDGFFKSANRAFDAGRVRAAFARPRVFGSKIDFSVETFFKTSVTLVDQFSYDHLGGTLQGRYPLLEKLQGKLSLSTYHERLFDVEEDVVLGDNDIGSTLYSLLETSITYDRRNDPFNPRKGFKSSVRFKVASEVIGSEVSFWGSSIQHSHFFTLGSRLVWASRLAGELLVPFGGTDIIPLSSRLFLGGQSSLRGYSKNSIGPRGALGNIVGGDSALNFSSELRYEFTENVDGIIFLDVGQTFLRKEGSFSGESNDLGNLRFSPGIGIHYKTPIGPVRLELGLATEREFGERRGKINLGIGPSF